jgi:hypothetical protein
MDASELAKLLARKTELESRLEGFEVWLIIFGILVVVGVAGESFLESEVGGTIEGCTLQSNP